MENIHDSVAWYQQKIGSYDKQLWEQSVEQKVLKGIQQAPRRSVKPKTELIDVDLIRGSTFTKAKPQVPWTYITLKTFSRVVLFPFHYQWWIQQTSLPFWLVLMTLYVMQIFTIIVFFNNVGDELFRDELSLSEVAIPCILMVLLGLIHSQTVLTHLKPPIRDTKRDTWRRKRSLSQNRSVSSSDLGASPSTQGADNSSQLKPNSKGQVSSRSLRSKDRKVRHKQNSQRQSARREHLNDKGSQDSESAYHTHEASDSLADRTSSLEQESNGSQRKVKNSSRSDGLISARVTVPGLKLKKEDLNEPISDVYRKARESQESDLPQDSNSEDEKLLKDGEEGLEKSKRNSQSISSENEQEEENIQINGNGQKEDKVDTLYDSIDNNSIKIEPHKNNKSNKLNETQNWVAEISEQSDCNLINGDDYKESTIDTCNSLDHKINFEGRSHRDVSPYKDIKSDALEHLVNESSTDWHCMGVANDVKKISETSDSSFLEVSVEDTAQNGITNGAFVSNIDNNQPTDVEPVKQVIHLGNLTSNLKSAHRLSSRERLGRPANSHNTVHFTSDLVNQREITPKSSREGTPTHSQSEVLLQSKHIRTSQKINELDTDTESDNEVQATKSLPNVRRRKGPSQDGTELNGTTLRHRRNGAGVTIRDLKANNTRVSSSDGETEGQSSEYSRGSRRNMASSEEWGDHLQSDVDTSSETSSCGSEPEISQHEEPEPESEEDPQAIGGIQGMTSSNLHVINLLHPSSGTSISHNPPDKVTCIIWERNECKKVELTAMDIGWAIIETVDKIPESSDYILIGITFSILMGFTPLLFQAFHAKDLPSLMSWDIFPAVWDLVCNNSWRENLIHANAIVQRLCLSAILFFMLSVADRTFKQRLLYAKHFCYLTSSRRARKFDMPHFRLNKVRNIRIWLSLRSYLKKRGPQRSVDMIVSSAFLLTLIMLILMCLQLLRDAEIYLNYLVNWEILVWCMALGIYLLRFMTLGLRINKKYRNLSVLITEQINLYLQMEQKPHKKEELMVANNVLKLAESLLKELESPFKISGISANPLILNITKVVVLSAFSAVLTELLGFKLKLYKIKLRA